MKSLSQYICVSFQTVFTTASSLLQISNQMPHTGFAAFRDQKTNYFAVQS